MSAPTETPPAPLLSDKPVREDLGAGLLKVDKLQPGRGYAELLAGVRGVGGDVVGFARGEFGWKPNPNTSLFAFGEAQFSPLTPPSYMAGVGARFTF